jgi:formylglycine-generating enzyme required for sulfatase activity
MNKMRKVFLLVLVGVLIYSCDKNRPYEVIGAEGRKPFYPEVPTGMTYIPAGGFTMGLHEQDMMQVDDARAKVVTISAFYMDQTEISNNEYRQFVEWVRDSIALERLVDRGLRDQMEEYINFDQEILFSIESNGTDVFITNFYADNKFANYKDITEETIEDFQTDLDTNTVVPETMDRNAMEIYSLLFEGYTDAKKVIVEETNPKQFNPKNVKKNWLSLNWNSKSSFNMWENPQLMPLLSDMYYSSKERYYKRREIDIRQLVYEYYWIDYKEAAKKGEIAYYDAPGAYDFSEKPQDASKRLNDLDGALLYQKLGDENNPTKFEQNNTRKPISYVNSNGTFTQINSDGKKREPGVERDTLLVDGITDDDSLRRDGFISGKDLDLGYMNRKMEWNAYRGHSDRSRFIIHEKIRVYPDTLCWVNDLTYSNGKEMANYFWHPAYDNYPVVGVTWKQAKAFSVWRTQLLNNYLVSEGDIYLNDFRLPTEAEWERAARGDLALQFYPWGGPYIRNAAGCFLGNFKPMRGRYFEDGGVYTVKVYSYNPNNFGLYCMAGNVSEWCESAYDESSYEFMDDINPEFTYDAKKWEPEVMKRKVIRGGSWKDIGHYLNVGSRSYEYQDTAKSYIGFRNVMTHLGRGGKDITKEGGEEIQSDINLR